MNVHSKQKSDRIFSGAVELAVRSAAFYSGFGFFYPRRDWFAKPMLVRPQPAPHPMKQIVIARTQALKLFRSKLGSPVRNLNSVIVGLSAVGNGAAPKPADLAVSWQPNDLKRAEIEARGFAIRSLMVTACDALDHYLYDLGAQPSPIRDSMLRSTLRRENQTVTKGKQLSDAAIEAFASVLIANKLDTFELKKKLGSFAELYCGKSQKPSVRKRHADLYKSCISQPKNNSLPAIPKQSYFSAVELLVAWRNVLVHDPDTDQLGSNALAVLEADAVAFADEHAGIDICQTIKNYEGRKEPTLKDISTLISILIRYVSSIDAALVSRCDISAYFQEAVAYELKNRASGMKTLRQWAGKSFDERVDKACNLVSPHGFIPGSFETKKGGYVGRQLSQQDFSCLKPSGLIPLAEALGIPVKAP